MSNTTEDPKDPAKYRPIALTSCIAKLYTSILKRRLEFFMLSNGYYIKPNLQKAFLPGIRGCIEHQFRLWRALQDARPSQRNLCAIWLDLANAYGSVHHKLIDFSLNHYHLPPKCKEIVQCIYRRFIKSNRWQTCLIPFRKGVFQGDPLSVIIFNMVINLYVDVISQPLYNSLSYQYSYVNGQLLLSQFADDTCLVSNSFIVLSVSNKYFMSILCLGVNESQCC